MDAFGGDEPLEMDMPPMPITISIPTVAWGDVESQARARRARAIDDQLPLASAAAGRAAAVVTSVDDFVHIMTDETSRPATNVAGDFAERILSAAPARAPNGKKRAREVDPLLEFHGDTPPPPAKRRKRPRVDDDEDDEDAESEEEDIVGLLPPPPPPMMIRHTYEDRALWCFACRYASNDTTLNVPKTMSNAVDTLNDYIESRFGDNVYDVAYACASYYQRNIFEPARGKFDMPEMRVSDWVIHIEEHVMDPRSWLLSDISRLRQLETRIYNTIMLDTGTDMPTVDASATNLLLKVGVRIMQMYKTDPTQMLFHSDSRRLDLGKVGQPIPGAGKIRLVNKPTTATAAAVEEEEDPESGET